MEEPLIYFGSNLQLMRLLLASTFFAIPIEAFCLSYRRPTSLLPPPSQKDAPYWRRNERKGEMRLSACIVVALGKGWPLKQDIQDLWSTSSMREHCRCIVGAAHAMNRAPRAAQQAED